MEKEKQMLMEEIFNQLDIYAMVLDDSSNILLTNKKVKDDFGEIIGKKCYEVHHNASSPPESCAMEKIKNGMVGEETFFDDAVTKKWYDVTVSKIKLEEKPLYIHLMSDVTQKHQSEERIVELNHALRVLNKILRHDMLNNISVIMVSLEMMKTKDLTLKNRALKAIEKSIELVNKMRDLEAAISSGGKLSPYDVNKIIKDSIVNFPEIKFKISGGCTVLADEALLPVLNNIIGNASIHGKADKIDISIEKRDDCCTVKISDNGLGIHDKIKGGMFDEGTSYGENQGMGLGLYIVKKTIERYGGDVSYEDNSPHGATFILKLKSV